ncbi:MAG: hypothetical protein GY710_01345 [Desulfobacteraceae bacterium]|nr:hypothetical protein [Desulfobacteraceae bacterium]
MNEKINDKTKMLISLGAATAANCIPCFEHLYYQAKNLGLCDEEILEAVETAVKVKNGAHIAIKSVIDGVMKGENISSDNEKCPCGCA